MLMSAKTYRDNYALPLVNKLKKIVKDLTVKCVQLMGRNKELSIRMERMEEVVKFLKKQVGEEKAKTTVLLKISDEFNYLKEFLGVEKTQSILANREKRKTVNLSSKDVEDKRKRMKEVRR